MSERFLNSFKSGGESFSRMRNKAKKTEKGRQSSSENSLGSTRSTMASSTTSSTGSSSRSLPSTASPGGSATVAPKFSPAYWNARYGKSCYLWSAPVKHENNSRLSLITENWAPFHRNSTNDPTEYPVWGRTIKIYQQKVLRTMCVQHVCAWRRRCQHGQRPKASEEQKSRGLSIFR